MQKEQVSATDCMPHIMKGVWLHHNHQ